jgi:hypothetical protein
MGVRLQGAVRKDMGKVRREEGRAVEGFVECVVLFSKKRIDNREVRVFLSHNI